jgi:hypothetical protein
LIAAFLILAGLILVREHQRCRVRAGGEQIDTDSTAGLGSAATPAAPSELSQDDVNAASRALL